MAVRITCIKKETGGTYSNPHLAIRGVSWINEQTQVTGYSSKEVMYDWIVNKNGSAYVRDPQGNSIYVFGIVSDTGEKYIRTINNKNWSDDLLGLPLCP